MLRNLPMLAVILWVFVSMCACATRTPEDPTGTRGSFQPPTSPSIVVENFQNAFNEKNTENFLQCLADTTTRSNTPYKFEPSAEVRARYQTLFDTWTTQKERQAFLSMIARLSIDETPNVVLTNGVVAFSSPDSVVYVSDYEINASLNLPGLPNTLRGTLVFTITPEPSGLWSIMRWSDAKRSADTSETTWSLLKASVSN